MRELSDLLARGDGEGVIAYRGVRRIDLAQFRSDIASNAARLADVNCRRGLLVTADSYWCAVGMLAMFQIGATVILPQNITEGASQAIGAEWDVLVSDQPAGERDRRLQLQSGSDLSTSLKPFDAKACRLSLFTSGSTGVPKRVEKTLAVMEREATAIEEMLGATVSPDSRVVGMVTHQHLFGLSYKLFWPLCSGRPFEARVHEYWEELLAVNLGQAVVIVSPAHLKRLGDLAPADDAIPPACLLSAGAELPEDVAVHAQRAFRAPLCEIYGSTETGTIGRRWRNEPDAPWVTAPGVTVEIGADAVLQIRSPFLADSNWFGTGDRAERVANGFRLKGRADRIIKIEGKRVSLPEIENLLVQSPLVAAAALLSVDADDATLAAVVVPSEMGTSELSRLGAFRFGRVLRQHLMTRQETAAIPRRWRFVTEMPMGSLGKTARQDLLRLFDRERREPDLLAVRRHGAEVELELFNRPDLVQLDGHFPNMPIIPGVAQVDWVVKFAARYLDLPVIAAQNYQVKFHRLTLPGTKVTLTMAREKEGQRLSFSYRRGDDVLTSGFIRLATT